MLGTGCYRENAATTGRTRNAYCRFSARTSLRRAVCTVRLFRKPELVGGGLIRILGGWAAARALRVKEQRIEGDERILGYGDFVQKVLDGCRQQLERRYRFALIGYDFDCLVGCMSKMFDLEPGLVTRTGRYLGTVEARNMLCYWAAREFGISTVELAKRLGISQSTASQSVKQGAKIVKEKELELTGSLSQ